MKKRIGIIFIILGILFLINAIFGRAIVIPGYLETLTPGVAVPDIPIIRIIRYLVWAYSFKFGIYFFVLGVLFKNDKKRSEIILFSIIGFVYIVVAYIPISFRSALFFGIVGSIITVFSLILFWIMAKSKRESNNNNIFEYIGLFFIIMAIYNLCGFTGVKCFALYPEKMIEYQLQDLAYSFANHIIVEFALGLIFLVYSKIKKQGK